MQISLWKHADAKTKHLVYGYIHELQQQLFPNEESGYYIIPNAIINICIIFYFMVESFTKCGKDMEVTEKYFVQKVRIISQWNTVYIKTTLRDTVKCYLVEAKPRPYT